MSRCALQYLLITPAKNEQAFIELTIRSVVSQTVRPLRWLVVSDGSTDRTNEIVAHYARQYDWIELLKMPQRQSRDFGGKAASSGGPAEISTLQRLTKFGLVDCIDQLQAKGWTRRIPSTDSSRSLTRNNTWTM